MAFASWTHTQMVKVCPQMYNRSGIWKTTHVHFCLLLLQLELLHAKLGSLEANTEKKLQHSSVCEVQEGDLHLLPHRLLVRGKPTMVA